MSHVDGFLARCRCRCPHVALHREANLPKSVEETRRGDRSMTLYVEGSWAGGDGPSAVKLSDGSTWVQDEYHYVLTVHGV